MDHREQARMFRDRAEECRSLAEIVTDKPASAGYAALAEVYEVLAADEDAQAAGLVNSGGEKPPGPDPSVHRSAAATSWSRSPEGDDPRCN